MASCQESDLGLLGHPEAFVQGPSKSGALPKATLSSETTRKAGWGWGCAGNDTGGLWWLRGALRNAEAGQAWPFGEAVLWG